MKKTIAVRVLSAFLLLCLIIPYGLLGAMAVYGDTKTDLDNEKKEQEKTKKELEATRKDIERLKGQSADAQKYMEELDQMMAEVDGELYELNNQIVKLEADIEETKEELARAEKDVAAQNEMMKLRIQFTYEHNDEGYLALLFSSESLSEMLNRAEYISQISAYDRKMLTEYQNTVNRVAETKAKLEREHTELADKKGTVEAKKARLTLMQEEKEKELAAYNAKLAELGQLEAKQLAEEEAREKRIREMEEQVKREEAANGGPVITEGSMFWPTISKRITCRYGVTTNRKYPHQGVDIGAVKPGVWGDPIYAAESGTVTLAGWDDGGGNWIWIYHGNGIYTVYMHCSKFLVKVGDKVNRGDTIALMGSTGNSTGAHLHFAVRINGTYVNSEPYIGIK